jgi:DNA-binding transcriptional LysR family regulator
MEFPDFIYPYISISMARRTNWENQIGQRLRLRDLHVLFVVAERGSMAKAATELGISQPSVSDVIANLETALGVRLLDRGPRGIEPTMYGQAVLKRGLAAFDELKQAIRDIEVLSDPTAGQLTIGCTEAVEAILAPILEPFFRKYPRVVVHIDPSDHMAPQLPALRARRCDLILRHLATPMLDDLPIDDLNVEILFNDRMVVTAGMRSPWANRRKVDLADLIDEPWILSAPTSWNYKTISEAFRARGLDLPRIRLVTYSVHVRADMVASGQCIATFPNVVARYFAARLAVKVLPVNLPMRSWPMGILTLKNRTLSPVVERFIQHLRDFTQPMRAEQ